MIIDSRDCDLEDVYDDRNCMVVLHGTAVIIEKMLSIFFFNSDNFMWIKDYYNWDRYMLNQVIELLSKGRFARITVEVDLSRPLVPSADIAVEYMRFPLSTAIGVWARPPILLLMW